MIKYASYIVVYEHMSSHVTLYGYGLHMFLHVSAHKRENRARPKHNACVCTSLNMLIYNNLSLKQCFCSACHNLTYHLSIDLRRVATPWNLRVLYFEPNSPQKHENNELWDIFWFSFHGRIDAIMFYMIYRLHICIYVYIICRLICDA